MSLAKMFSGKPNPHKINNRYEYIGFPYDNKYEIKKPELLKEIQELEQVESIDKLTAVEIVDELYKYLPNAKLQNNKTVEKFIFNYFRCVINYSDYMDEYDIANAILTKQEKYKRASEIIFQTKYFKNLDRKSNLFAIKFSEITIEDLKILNQTEQKGYKYIVCKRLQSNELFNLNINCDMESLMKLTDLDANHNGTGVKEVIEVLTNLRSQNETVYDYLFNPKLKQKEIDIAL